MTKFRIKFIHWRLHEANNLVVTTGITSTQWNKVCHVYEEHT